MNGETMTRRFDWLVLLCVLQSACTGGESVEVPLSALTADPQRFDGRQVSTRGTVRGIEEPLHFWIEDERFNRVQLLPPEAVQPFVGQEVRVVGRYSYTRREGRRLQVHRLEALGGDPPDRTREPGMQGRASVVTTSSWTVPDLRRLVGRMGVRERSSRRKRLISQPFAQLARDLQYLECRPLPPLSPFAQAMAVGPRGHSGPS
jgi:hypothetical protein